MAARISIATQHHSPRHGLTTCRHRCSFLRRNILSAPRGLDLPRQQHIRVRNVATESLTRSASRASHFNKTKTAGILVPAVRRDELRSSLRDELGHEVGAQTLDAA